MNENVDTMIQDSDVEALLERAQKRPLPPVKDEQAIRKAVEDEWLAVARRRRVLRYLRQTAIAATVMLAAFLTFNAFQPNIADVQPVASIEYRFGLIYQVGSGSELSEADSVSGIRVGDVIRTGDESGLAINWLGGGSVRIDGASRVEFVSDQAIRLHAGRMYFDSAPMAADQRSANLTVLTEHGQIAHIGTQYVAEIEDGSLVVSVRDGQVVIEQPTGERITAATNEQVSVSNGGLRNRLAISAYGGAWSWVDLTTPPRSVDGLSVDYFLNWVAHETGLSVRYASEQIKRIAEDDRLIGNVAMQPLAALDFWRQATQLDWEVEDGVIYVDWNQ